MMERMEPYAGAMTIPLRNPCRYVGFFEHLHEVMRGPGSLTVAEREFVAAVATCANGAMTCFADHTAIAAALGLSESAVRRLAAGAEAVMEDGSTAERYGALQIFIVRLAHAAPLTRDYWTRCLEAGWSVDDLELTIIIVAAFSAVSRFALGANPAGFDEGRTPDFTPEEAYEIYRSSLARICERTKAGGGAV